MVAVFRCFIETDGLVEFLLADFDIVHFRQVSQLFPANSSFPSVFLRSSPSHSTSPRSTSPSTAANYRNISPRRLHTELPPLQQSAPMVRVAVPLSKPNVVRDRTVFTGSRVPPIQEEERSLSNADVAVTHSRAMPPKTSAITIQPSPASSLRNVRRRFLFFFLFILSQRPSRSDMR